MARRHIGKAIIQDGVVNVDPRLLPPDPPIECDLWETIDDGDGMTVLSWEIAFEKVDEFASAD